MKRWIVPAMFMLLAVAGPVAAGYGANSASPWIGMALILLVSAWFLIEGQRAARMWFVAVVLIATIAAVSAVPLITTAAGMDDGGQLKKFSSYEELKNFVRTNVNDASYFPYYDPFWGLVQSFFVARSGVMAPAPARGEALESRGAPAPSFSFTIDGKDFNFTIDEGTINISTDYSNTNIQIEGVDEADIVKCDGKYVYVVSKNKVIIIDVYPAENARILCEIEVNPIEIFINGDKLVVLGRTFAKVYDISDRENPILKRNVSFDGWYFNSRMVGNFVYLLINSPTIYCCADEIDLPKISSNGNVRTIQATEIYYFDIPSPSYVFVTIMSINTQDDDEEIRSETFLMDTTQNIFVSSKNIYITYTSYGGTEKTIIHKIAIAGGEIEYKSRGEVPGHVLNQFSMGEYQGYFRIATTTGWYEANHVYVLDEDLNITGRLEGLAPGERIYSARFMGNRAYLVTFKKVDPLFVIDLADPANPKVLGKLKIPGYSDYLHPYDETHLIGVGKDTVDASGGNFAWYQGVKIALFDVSDPENPREISKYIIGQRGTDSLALRDHKAFLFSRSKNLLVIPAGYHSQDAYVFHVSPENGLVLKGTITHSEGAEAQEVSAKSSCYPSYNYSVKRSLYIDSVLYTISDELIKMNNLESLNEINKIEL